MKTLFITIVSFFCVVQAQAARDLTDLMTPDEIAEEMFFEAGPSSLAGNLLWNASAQESRFTRLQIIINTAQKGKAVDAQTLEAFLDGVLLYRAIVSTGKQEPVFIPPNKKYPNGRHYTPKTWPGVYGIHYRSRNHVSKTWEGASMPFAQFFDGGIAIHATTPEHFHELGRRASGGCVRMHPRDAEIMWRLVGDVTVAETQIIVYDGTLHPHPLQRLNELPYYVMPALNLKAPVKKKKPVTPKVTPTPTPAPLPIVETLS